MKRGRLLSPEEVRTGERVIVVPCAEGVHRGIGLGHYHPEGQHATVDDPLLSMVRRGTMHLYHVDPETAPARVETATPAQPEEHA
jgi:hypothetical protein